jgi:hypothetical protein
MATRRRTTTTRRRNPPVSQAIALIRQAQSALNGAQAEVVTEEAYDALHAALQATYIAARAERDAAG